MNAPKRFIFRNVIPALGCLLVGKNKYCNVIYYHDIVSGKGETFMRTNIDIFRSHMEYIAANGFETLRFDDLEKPENLAFGKKKVIIAFDDGWRSNYSRIFDFMKSLGLKYSIFLTMGKIGTDEDYLTWDMVREMHESGLVGFGAHTFTHPNMADLSAVDYDLEIVKADQLFEKELGFKPLDFCYPFGKYSLAANKTLEEDGRYHRIYTSSNMYSYKENGAVIMGRNGINEDWPFRVFKNQLRGYYNIFHSLTH